MNSLTDLPVSPVLLFQGNILDKFYIDKRNQRYCSQTTTWNSAILGGWAIRGWQQGWTPLQEFVFALQDTDATLDNFP